jgi:hypothetical protein
MNPKPSLWNALVIGAWNLAILSPDGIRRRLFNLPDNTNIELELAVDRPGYFRVSHNGMVVAPTANSLEVFPRVPSAASLQEACTLAAFALEQLPETPVTAAGVNIRYDFTELPDMVQDLISAPLDDVLSDRGHRIETKGALRTLDFSPGVVNLQVTDTMPGGKVEFNFHRESSSSADLREWLAKAAEFAQVAEQIASIIGVSHVGREVNV